MRRIYFLLDSQETGRNIVNELLIKGIEARHLHVMAREGMDLQGLPEANFLQKSDVVPALETGLAVGAALGLVVGFLAMLLPQGGMGGPGMVLVTTLAGGIIGAWASSMIGIDAFNRRLRGFQAALDEGKLLLMIDVSSGRVEEVEALVTSRFPQARLMGEEPTIPAFP